MMKLLVISLIVLFSQTAVAAKYSGCTDPQYISYVERRLSFYEEIDKERYQEAQDKLSAISKDYTSTSFKYVLLSARFDSPKIAQNNIIAYEQRQVSIMQKLVSLVMKNGDSFHNTTIAKGWLALNSGDEDKAIHYLLASTKTKGSPVLGSFGPDKTLIRELYKRGQKQAVLEYLKRSALFWNTDSAHEYIRVWRKMIKNDCPIQFQFYDTTSIKELGLQ